MPPRYSYWTILAGGLPTAFRAAERADLLPTFNRIRDKHPDAEMKWFARGRLWDSPEAAQEDLERVRARRDRDWRPGGDHRDPRKKFKDAKREGKNARPRREAPRATAGPASRTKDRPATAARDNASARDQASRAPTGAPCRAPIPSARPTQPPRKRHR